MEWPKCSKTGHISVLKKANLIIPFILSQKLSYRVRSQETDYLSGGGARATGKGHKVASGYNYFPLSDRSVVHKHVCPDNSPDCTLRMFIPSWVLYFHLKFTNKKAKTVSHSLLRITTSTGNSAVRGAASGASLPWALIQVSLFYCSRTLLVCEMVMMTVPTPEVLLSIKRDHLLSP